MKLKVRKTGDSLSVTLPDDYVSQWHVRPGDTLEVTEVSDGLYRIVAKKPEPPTLEEKLAKADEIIARYRNTLNELSK